MAVTALTLPSPRPPLPGPSGTPAGGRAVAEAEAVRRWYERELGWATAWDGPGTPVRLPAGPGFDVLDVPEDAGHAVLRRLAPEATGPVALWDARVLLLISAGGADDVPGLLDWLEWRGIELDLTPLGEGAWIPAPDPSGAGAPMPPALPGSGGSAVWLRPPEPGKVALPAWPALPGIGGGKDTAGPGCRVRPDLARLVGVAATECHRARLSRARAAKATDQPLAFS